jgi:hypothetical protein
MRKVSILLLALALTSCSHFSVNGTQVKEVNIDQIVPLNKIISADDATKALIILQDFRVSSIRVLKQTRPEKVDSIRDLDNNFRASWSTLKLLVEQWRLTNENGEAVKAQYKQLLNLALQYEMVKE